MDLRVFARPISICVSGLVTIFACQGLCSWHPTHDISCVVRIRPTGFGSSRWTFLAVLSFTRFFLRLSLAAIISFLSFLSYLPSFLLAFFCFFEPEHAFFCRSRVEFISCELNQAFFGGRAAKGFSSLFYHFMLWGDSFFCWYGFVSDAPRLVCFFPLFYLIFDVCIVSCCLSTLGCFYFAFIQVPELW